MNIVILDYEGINPGDLSFEKLEKLGNLTLYKSCPKDDEVIIERCKDADMIVVVYTKINEKVMEALPKLKYIGLLSTGFNHIDLEAARKNNITVTNVPGYGSDAVAQHALALLLEVTNMTGFYNRDVKKGRWGQVGSWHFEDYPVIELKDKTIGILGLGKIGLQAAKIYKAMGMKVLAYNRSQNDQAKKYLDYVGLDTIFEKSDIIDLHLPLNDGTENIINKKSIEKMKDGVIIINTARGGLIDESALIEAIENGKIYGVGFDVVRKEPIADDNPLLKYNNIIITPHMAWAARETRQRLMDIASDNIKAFIDGKEKNKVN